MEMVSPFNNKPVRQGPHPLNRLYSVSVVGKTLIIIFFSFIYQDINYCTPVFTSHRFSVAVTVFMNNLIITRAEVII